MKVPFYYKEIPKSRIATFDIMSVGIQRHHVSALLEFDVTQSRKKLYELRRKGINISFNAWLIKSISTVLQKHPEASAFLSSKNKLIIFSDINISILVERKINGKRVPLPVVLEKTNEKSALEITAEIEGAKNQVLSGDDIVINKNTSLAENLYYLLPGSIRRAVWRLLLANPKIIYKKMGNAVVTSIGMIGRINGWFIHKTIHPVSFGIGSVIKKPVVINNNIEIREILNMTILADHDVIDGAPMVRFLNDFTKIIETGELIDGMNF